MTEPQPPTNDGTAVHKAVGTNTSPNIAARRILWTEARAKNAAKRGWLIASVGLLAVTITVAVLVLLPREVDRVLRVRIDALPPMVDTLALQALLDSARSQQQRADTSLRKVRNADADRVAEAAGKDAPADLSAVLPPASEDEARRDLTVRVARARSAPLVESYRAVGEAELLGDDVRARGLMDSLNSLNRDREAYAALGGADARYASLTARITAIGQRLVVIAEQRLTNTVVVPSTAIVSDTTPPVQHTHFTLDSVADQRAQSALDSANARVVRAGQTLERARLTNADIIKKRDATRAEFTVVIPQVAMVLAALVVGLAVGYGVAFAAEARQPRIADVAEVERITGARVIVHSGSARAKRASRRRQNGDNKIPGIIDTASDTYQLLHVMLTGFGDTTRIVRVMSDSPALTAAVGINLAAAVARESRAALLVDGDKRAGLAAGLLNAQGSTGVAEAMMAPATLSSHITRVTVGREQFLKALFAGGEKLRKQNDKSTHPSEFVREFDQLVQAHDLTVLLASSEAEASHSWLPSVDVILCAQVGKTRVNWLTRSVLHLRASGIRLRAVLLWSADTPKAR